MGGGVKPPKSSPNQFLGSSMSRLFPEPLNDRMFPPAALFQDFLLRPPTGSTGGPPVSGGAPIFGGTPGCPPFSAMQDLPQELDTVAITTKVKEKLANHNLGQKVRYSIGHFFLQRLNDAVRVCKKSCFHISH